MPESLLPDIDREILEQVIDHAKSRKIDQTLIKGELAPAFISYVEQLVRYATGEDELWADPAALFSRAAAAWNIAQTRAPGQNRIVLRIEEGGEWADKRLVLDVVTDDKPFLVDSLSAALSEFGRTISFFSNAVVDVARDNDGERTPGGDGPILRESVIHAEMDPPVADADIDLLRDEIERVLADVAAAVADWEPMRARLAASIAQLERSRVPGLKSDEQKEAVDFLKWLWDNRFAFLGVRSYAYSKKDGVVEFVRDEALDLGIMKDPSRRILKATFQDGGELSPAVEAFMESSEPILLAKANTRSLVHRRVHMDYIGVKSYGLDGAVTGENRFAGLFSADAYNRPATDIPLLRAKIRAVLDRTEFNPGGHNEKALINILETYPRDELFQIDVDTLQDISLRILRLYKRPRAKLFMRRDRFDRFVSALVYVPRDRFNSDIREAIGELLAKAFNGRVSAFSPFFGDTALARVHFIIGLDPGAPEGPGEAALTEQIRRLCRSWSDDLLESMRKAYGGATPAALFEKYEKAFGAGYREQADMVETLRDIGALEQLSEKPIVLRAYRNPQDGDDVVRLKLYVRGGPLPLSKLIPTLENLGLSVILEDGYHVFPYGAANSEAAWIHDFHTKQRQEKPVRLDEVGQLFEETILAVLEGRTEDDRFNGLVLTAGLNWREAWLLRAAAKHHVQAGFAYSQSFMEDALLNNPTITRDLTVVFHAKFNPAGARDLAARRKEIAGAEKRVIAALEQVESLAEDRVIRRFLNFFAAVLRTNYYQSAPDGAHRPYISFKVDSVQIDEIPEPRPYREIFMSGPRVDGVHLRFGPIARGGLRWSDRREDFRTEVLGLVKAQRVKNAVIVPTGAKGGFYPKQLPQSADRAAIYEEGREAYKLFVRSLLDLTDNIVKGKIKHPKDVVLWDDPDPYLVVAADKGTAQFSDTANAISAEYGFWLGDAFASGGSAGYDHKTMGITARGAWEAVKRHFRELGKDIQKEAFTVAGVGDMSGDVFGNGMLLSKKIRLVAAFDHRDIFIDPNPNPTKSYNERKRLFDLPRSSWRDYDESLISKGGGVFSRAAKSISLTPEMRKILATDAKALAPNELIKAILKAPVELIWLGGIGTYFKSEKEDHWRVGDRANDVVRVDAADIRAEVIGEGANLGLTQRARIEFALRGGRVNTDAIDNSAGVDSSDHEVNIKILLSSAIEQAELKAKDRNDLLASMTDDVAEYVLRHNYDQTRALTLMEATASADIDIHARFMATLERAGRLNRSVESLPTEEEIAERRQQNRGLTRPELAVLLAYAKMLIFDELVASETPDDPVFEAELFHYFPAALHEFTKPVVAHQLRREIIATRISNEMMDSCGVSFAQRVIETSNADFPTIALAYEAARRIYGLGDFAQAVDALDNNAPPALQTALYLEASSLLKEQAFRLLTEKRSREILLFQGVKNVVARYQAPAAELKKALSGILPRDAAAALEARADDWAAKGAPKTLAHEAALLRGLENAFDIADLAVETGWSNPGVGAVYFALARMFNIDALRRNARAAPPMEHFDKIALREIVDDVGARLHRLTRAVLNFADAEPAGEPENWISKLLARWEECYGEEINQFRMRAGELDIVGSISVGKLTLFVRFFDELIDALEA